MYLSSKRSFQQFSYPLLADVFYIWFSFRLFSSTCTIIARFTSIFQCIMQHHCTVLSVQNRFLSTLLRQYSLLSRHLSAPQSYFPCFLLHKTSVESSYTDPSLFRTVITVLNKIFISNPKFQLLIYSVSSRTTSSKSVISLRPLTCHIPVIPGLMAILAL